MGQELGAYSLRVAAYRFGFPDSNGRDEVTPTLRCPPHSPGYPPVNNVLPLSPYDLLAALLG
jgi:hypothetical protein